MGTKNRIDTLKRYFFFFMAYAVIGWIYEVVLEVVIYRWGYSDRGVLIGPYCVIYGVGAMLFLVTMYPLIQQKACLIKLKLMPGIFIGCMGIATAVELAASYLCEWVLGHWPWQTYANYAINFQGRIALSPSIRFGLGGVLFLYIIQPMLERMLDSMRDATRRFLLNALPVLLALDLAASAVLYFLNH